VAKQAAAKGKANLLEIVAAGNIGAANNPT